MSLFNHPPPGQQMPRDQWSTPINNTVGQNPFPNSLASSSLTSPLQRQPQSLFGPSHFYSSTGSSGNSTYGYAKGSMPMTPTSYGALQSMDQDIFGAMHTSVSSSLSNQGLSDPPEEKHRTPQGEHKFSWNSVNVGGGGSNHNGNNGIGGSLHNDNLIFSQSPIISSGSVMTTFQQQQQQGQQQSSNVVSAENGTTRIHNIETMLLKLDNVVMDLKAELKLLDLDNSQMRQEILQLRDENKILKNYAYNNNIDYNNANNNTLKNPPLQTEVIGLSPVKEADTSILPTPPAEAIAPATFDKDYTVTVASASAPSVTRGSPNSEPNTPLAPLKKYRKPTGASASKPSPPPKVHSSSTTVIAVAATITSSNNSSSSGSSTSGAVGYYEAVVYGVEKTLSMQQVRDDIEQNDIQLACMPRPLLRNPEKNTMPSTTVHSVVISFHDEESMRHCIEHSVPVNYAMRRVKALRTGSTSSGSGNSNGASSSTNSSSNSSIMNKRRTSQHQQPVASGDWKKKDYHSSSSNSRTGANSNSSRRRSSNGTEADYYNNEEAVDENEENNYYYEGDDY